MSGSGGYPILTRVNSPKDLKDLSLSELRGLCRDIREFIVHTVSQTGGHLASNLGSVELTVAIHRVFDAPRDRIVFDVGHQAYPHKILTERKESFHTLRQFGGISGFPNPNESPYDTFMVGHASTSIAAAMGMAKARDLKSEDHHVVAVIGDGAMTGGIAFEAINNASNFPSRLIVILNDNAMSISPNVGGMSRHLSYLRTIPTVRNIKAGTLKALRRIPLIGKRIARSIDAAGESLFYFVTPTREGVMFEEFGFTYLGPFDGHNLKVIIDVLRSAKNWSESGPILIHLHTRKGKGYIPAEGAPTSYHGVGAFDPSVTKVEKVAVKEGNNIKPSYTEIFADAILELGVTDRRIVAITAAMAEGTGLDKFRDRIPERFFDVGIAEQFAVTFAAGLATQGMKPVAAIYSTFLQRAFDQCIHDIGLQRLPVVFALDRGGIVGADGATHQGVFDLSYLRMIPNFVVMAPKDENELRDMLYTAIEYNDGPIALRYPRGSAQGVELLKGFREIPIGEAEILREGHDITIIGIGNMVHVCMEAADKLAESGIEAAVINARFVKPLDRDLILEWSRRTGRVITVEENVLMGGFGSAVLELLDSEGLLNGHHDEACDEAPIEIERIGLPDKFIEHGSQKELRKHYGLTVDDIYESARSMVGKVRLSVVGSDTVKETEPERPSQSGAIPE